MKILGFCLVAMVGIQSTHAMSNVAATWIEDGNTLSVQIVDNPSEGPFTAAEIWAAIKPDRIDSKGRRQVKTSNLELACEALSDSSGELFGTCKIRVAKSQVMDNGNALSFAVFRNEGKEALEAFVNPGSDSIVIRSGHTDEQQDHRLIFEANWRHQMVAGLIAKAVVSE